MNLPASPGQHFRIGRRARSGASTTSWQRAVLTLEGRIDNARLTIPRESQKAFNEGGLTRWTAANSSCPISAGSRTAPPHRTWDLEQTETRGIQVSPGEHSVNIERPRIE